MRVGGRAVEAKAEEAGESEGDRHTISSLKMTCGLRSNRNASHVERGTGSEGDVPSCTYGGSGAQYLSCRSPSSANNCSANFSSFEFSPCSGPTNWTVTLKKKRSVPQ